MWANIIDATENKAICLIFVPDIIHLPDGAELNLDLNRKRQAFRVVKNVKGICSLIKIENVSDYYCPDKSYNAFIDEIYNWNEFYLLAK